MDIHTQKPPICNSIPLVTIMCIHKTPILLTSLFSVHSYYSWHHWCFLVLLIIFNSIWTVCLREILSQEASTMRDRLSCMPNLNRPSYWHFFALAMIFLCKGYGWYFFCHDLILPSLYLGSSSVWALWPLWRNGIPLRYVGVLLRFPLHISLFFRSDG